MPLIFYGCSVSSSAILYYSSDIMTLQNREINICEMLMWVEMVSIEVVKLEYRGLSIFYLGFLLTKRLYGTKGAKMNPSKLELYSLYARGKQEN